MSCMWSACISSEPLLNFLAEYSCAPNTIKYFNVPKQFLCACIFVLVVLRHRIMNKWMRARTPVSSEREWWRAYIWHTAHVCDKSVFMSPCDGWRMKYEAHIISKSPQLHKAFEVYQSNLYKIYYRIYSGCRLFWKIRRRRAKPHDMCAVCMR